MSEQKHKSAVASMQKELNAYREKKSSPKPLMQSMRDISAWLSKQEQK